MDERQILIIAAILLILFYVANAKTGCALCRDVDLENQFIAPPPGKKKKDWGRTRL